MSDLLGAYVFLEIRFLLFEEELRAVRALDLSVDCSFKLIS